MRTHSLRHGSIQTTLIYLEVVPDPPGSLAMVPQFQEACLQSWCIDAETQCGFALVDPTLKGDLPSILFVRSNF